MLRRIDRSARWNSDPIVWLGSIVGGAATAFAVFADRYLPYIDWAAHIGLISVLAHGGDTGALDYYERSYAPSPYLLFYLASAIIGQLVAVDVAAKLVLVLTASMTVLGAASLAEATDRDPRVSLVAPLAMFGLSMSWGFGSFVFAMPFLLFSLAASERAFQMFERHATIEGALRSREAIVLAVWLALLFNAHGFMFVVGVAAIAVRGMAFVLARLRSRAAWRSVLGVVLCGVPAVLIMLPTAIMLVRNPSIEGHVRPAQVIAFDPLSTHLATLPTDLLDRGSPDHVAVMKWTIVLFFAWAAWSLFRPHRRIGEKKTYGLEIFAAFLVALWAFGPMTVEWPSSIWLIYPRFAIIAALVVLLLPMASLRGELGTLLAVAPLVLVGANASLNAEHIRNFSEAARPYDRVRAVIPPNQRIIQLSVLGAHEPQLEHHALGGLYSYLMVDGASYVAFLFDKAELPVHLRRDRPPLRAPFWTSPASFDPKTHGRDYDYLILRGEYLVRRTEQSQQHDEVAEVDGWHIFKTRVATPRPPP